jgi:arsenate reductase
MAEGWGRRLAPPGVVVHSAGSEPGQLNPYALRAMAEVGIDISTQTSKPISAIPLDRIATVVTLCAEEICPVFPGEVARLHWPLDDPAAVEGSEEQILARFRGVRDAIGEKIRELFAR